MSTIENMLIRFIIDNYSSFDGELIFRKFDGSYFEHATDGTKSKLTSILAQCSIFNPPAELTLYPLVPIRVHDDFDSPPFFLIRPSSLSFSYLGQELAGRLTPSEFPPVDFMQVRKERPTSWLGVRSPITQASNKTKAAILGSLALTPHPHYRHQFSMRDMFGGLFIVNAQNFAITRGEAHTPAMSVDIVIRQSDHAWLSVLASKLLSNEPAALREIRALEYFYRAWPLDPSERFPWLFMALDAVFGDSSRATQAIIEAISQQNEQSFGYDRLRLLLGLRSSVIHGGAPDVYDSSKYQRYYELYGSDPIFDLGSITVRSLRSRIFGTALVEHADPYANIPCA